MLRRRFGNEHQQEVQKRYGEVRRLALKAETIVAKVVAEHSETLDKFVDKVDEMLERVRKGERFEDGELQRLVLRLPVLMYRLSDLNDRAAIESDLAKAVTKNLNAVHYLQSTAKTIPAKKADADLRTAELDDVVELTKHVYQRLKNKFETADKLFDAIRKVIGSRDTHKTVFGREERGPLRRSS